MAYRNNAKPEEVVEKEKWWTWERRRKARRIFIRTVFWALTIGGLGVCLVFFGRALSRTYEQDTPEYRRAWCISSCGEDGVALWSPDRQSGCLCAGSRSPVSEEDSTTVAEIVQTVGE